MEGGYDSVGGGAMGAASGAMSGAMAGTAIMPGVGTVIGGLLGGLFGSKSTKVPKPPSYSAFLGSSLTGQEGIQSRLLGLEGTYRPQYQTLQEKTLTNQLYGGDGQYGYIDMLNRSNNALLGVQSQYAKNYMTTLGGLTQQARNVIESPANAAMHGKMMADAQRDLNLGTSLNADEQRQAFQTANQAMAMRGMAGRQGVAAGVMANYNLGQQRLGQRRQFAASMMGAETALQNAALQAGQAGMAGYGAGGKFMAEANTMLGQYQPQIFQPESQANMNLVGANYQQQMGIAKANMQQQAGLLSTMAQFGSFGMQGGFKGVGAGLKEFGGQYFGMNTWTPESGGWINGQRFSPSDW